MNKIEFKKEALVQAKEKIQEIVTHIQSEVAQIKESEMIIDQDQFDDTEQSQNEASHEVMNSLAGQINFALDELRLLDRMKVQEPLLKEVAPATIVKTNQKTFFISVGLEDFLVGGQHVFGISTAAPIYQAMKGKQKGDRFTFRDIDYRIEDVF